MSVSADEADSSRVAARPARRFRDLLFDRARSSPLVIAHRGASAHAPENTLEAGRLGWEAGADAWELDVQLTRDGVPVVVHDESLALTTDVALRFPRDPRGEAGFRVADFDLAELRTLDAGSWFLAPTGGARTAAGFGTLEELPRGNTAGFAGGGVRVPTLAEALELTIELDWYVNVELKSFPNACPGLLEAVLATIDRTGAADRVHLSSFDHADVARAARLRPEISTGILAATPLHRPHDYVRGSVGADGYHPSAAALGAGADAYRRSPSAAALRAADLDELGRAGIPVLVYTVNEAEPGGLASHLARAGVAGLFTDHPGRMRRLFRVG